MRKNMIRGSCFGVKNLEEEPVDKTKHWGDLEEEEEEAEEEEEMEENELGDGTSVHSLSCSFTFLQDLDQQEGNRQEGKFLPAISVIVSKKINRRKIPAGSSSSDTHERYEDYIDKYALKSYRKLQLLYIRFNALSVCISKVQKWILEAKKFRIIGRLSWCMVAAMFLGV